MSVADYAAQLRAACLGPEPSAADLASLGDEAWRWLRYRLMVQRRFQDTIEHAFPRVKGALGADHLANLVERFLSASPPRSPYLRDVPGEFLTWFEGSLSFADHTTRALPEYIGDLARFEWAKQSTTYDEDEPVDGAIAALRMDRPAVLLRAHRVLRMKHAVHRIESDEVPVREPTFVCVYRDPITHQARVLELTRVAAALLEAIREGKAPLIEIVKGVASREEAPLDLSFLEATSEWLADLSSRGLVLGSLDDPNPPGKVEP